MPSYNPISSFAVSAYSNEILSQQVRWLTTSAISATAVKIHAAVFSVSAGLVIAATPVDTDAALISLSSGASLTPAPVITRTALSSDYTFGAGISPFAVAIRSASGGLSTTVVDNPNASKIAAAKMAETGELIDNIRPAVLRPAYTVLSTDSTADLLENIQRLAVMGGSSSLDGTFVPTRFVGGYAPFTSDLTASLVGRRVEPNYLLPVAFGASVAPAATNEVNGIFAASSEAASTLLAEGIKNAVAPLSTSLQAILTGEIFNESAAGINTSSTVTAVPYVLRNAVTAVFPELTSVPYANGVYAAKADLHTRSDWSYTVTAKANLTSHSFARVKYSLPYIRDRIEFSLGVTRDFVSDLTVSRLQANQLKVTQIYSIQLEL